MFLDILDLKIENKTKKTLRTTVLKVWFQMFGKKILCVHKSAFRKNVQKLKTTKNHKNFHNLCWLKQTKLFLFVNF